MSKFRIGYVGFVPHPNFLATAAQDPALEIVHIPLEVSTGEQIQALSSCHGYYVMAARDELPLPLHVHAELLGKLPNLLMAASYGAGYDYWAGNCAARWWGWSASAMSARAWPRS